MAKNVRPRCRPYCHLADWKDSRTDKNGNIRTTCSRCGAFIGNRPAERKQGEKLKGN